MRVYIAAVFLSSVCFGLTNTAVYLPVMKHISPAWFVFGNITASLLMFTINRAIKYPTLKHAVWRHRMRLILIDMSLFLVVSLISYWSFTARFLLFATVSVVTNELLVLLWEYKKEHSGCGVALHSSRESAMQLGNLVGMCSLLVLELHGLAPSLLPALLLQAMILSMEAAALAWFLRR